MFAQSHSSIISGAPLTSRCSVRQDQYTGDGIIPMKLSRRAFIASLPVVAAAQRPQFSFGVVADIQYADKDAAGPRQYRDSIRKVNHWQNSLFRERLDFVVHLGDLIDEGLENLPHAFDAFRGLNPNARLVLGNHDFTIPRNTLLPRLGLKSAYYDFTVRDWRFIVVDGMDVAAKGGWPEDHPNAQLGRSTLASLKQSGARNANDWNGAVGAAQLEWLAKTLDDASRLKQRALVFGHFPLLPEGCRPDHLLWNYAELLDILDRAPAVAGYFNGHDHRGGLGSRGGLHYVTLKGLVEHEPADACRIVDVYPDRLVLRGGPAPLTLPLRQAADANLWTSLFDGKSLNGWRVECKPEDRGKEFWTARDGLLSCDSVGRKEHDYVWLLSEAEYSDFELELEVRGSDSPGNSGLQFRSRYDKELGWLHGPQVDIHPPAPFRTGLIYDETREARRWIHPSLPDWKIEPAQAPHDFHWDPHGWNRLRLVCQGTRVDTWLNGLPVTSFDGAGILDDKAHLSRNAGLKGHFALQLHAKDELRIAFRSIRVRPLTTALRSSSGSL